jgi:cobalt-zinc-cadmium efflux system protein
MAMSMSAVPPVIDPGAVRSYLEQCAGVAHVHDLHIWPMSTTEVALTCHMVIPAGQPGDAYLLDVAHRLKEDFGIQHATVQVETDPNSPCALAPDHVV